MRGLSAVPPPLKARNLRAFPNDPAIRLECNCFVWRLGKRFGAGGKLARKHLGCGMARRPTVDTVAGGVGREAETIEAPDIVVLHQDPAVRTDLRRHLLLVAQPAHQHAGPTVNEALREPLVQSVRQLVLHGTGDVLPVLGIGKPIRTIGREGPGADMGDAVRQRVDVAIGAIRLLDLEGEPVGGNRPLPHQEAIKRRRELGVGGGRDLAIVRHLADFP